MKAIALIALALALEAGFLFTLAVPAGDLAAWRRGPAGPQQASMLAAHVPAAPPAADCVPCPSRS